MSNECTKNHTDILVKRLTFFRQDKYIYEQVSQGFVKWDTTNGTFEIVSHVHTGELVDNPAFKLYKDGTSNGKPALVEIVYYPLVNDTVKTGQIILPDKPEPCEGIMPIIEEIEKLSEKWIFIAPEEIAIFKVQLRIAVASWFLYVFDNVNIPERVAGLLGVVGVSGGGKKRFLTLLRMFAYRPIYTLNSTKIPSTFRLVEPWGHATLLVDEADQKDTGSEAEWIQFFNARYDGTPLSRYNMSKDAVDIFQSFGLTAFALRRLPKDEGTISRMTKLNATISPIELPELAGQEIFTAFSSIRNKLLYLRLKNFGKLQYVSKSGLPPEHSWRGKEILTLVKTLAQIDPKVEEDLLQISTLLTKREIENLSQSWDGIIIDEIYNFITQPDAEARWHNKSLYFVRPYKDKYGEEQIMALNLVFIARALSSTSSEINRSLVQMKIGTYERFRIEGARKAIRGVLSFQHIEDTDRIFSRYIPGYNHILLTFKDEGKQETLTPQKKESVEKKGEAGEKVKEMIDEVKKNFEVVEDDSGIDQYGNYRIAVKRPQEMGKVEVIKAFMKTMGFDMVTGPDMGNMTFIKKVGE